MGCACKSSSSNKQVTSIKQVVKKSSMPSSSRPQRKNIIRRVVFKKN